jgi:Ca2+-transporting ATPase
MDDNVTRMETTFLKGAIEVILPQCVTFMGINGDLQLLTKEAKSTMATYCDEMSSNGLRVIAVAYGSTTNQLTLCGILGLMDPLRPMIKEAVHRIQDR